MNATAYDTTTPGTTTPGTTTPGTTAHDTAEQQARALIDALYAAWAAGDADAFAAFYTPDATAALPGSFRDGRERIRTEMAAGFAGPLRGSTVRDEIHRVRLLGTDARTALIVARNAVVFAGETDVPADRWVRATWVLERTGDDVWHVAAYHNCAD